VGPPGRSPVGAPGAPGRGAEDLPWPPWAVPGLRKSAGVTGDLGGPGTLEAPGTPGDPWGLESGRARSGSGPGRDAGDGATGGSRRASVSGVAGPAAVPFATAPSGTAARSAEPLAAPSGAVLGTGGDPETPETPGAPETVPAAAATARSSWGSRDAVPAPASGRGRAPAAGPAWAAEAVADATPRGVDDPTDLGDAATGLDCADCCVAVEANASLSRRTTGASIVEEADLTNSPISLSWSMTALLSTPNSFASS
jgi:hypothetical protein